MAAELPIDRQKQIRNNRTMPSPDIMGFSIGRADVPASVLGIDPTKRTDRMNALVAYGSIGRISIGAILVPHGDTDTEFAAAMYSGVITHDKRGQAILGFARESFTHFNDGHDVLIPLTEVDSPWAVFADSIEMLQPYMEHAAMEDMFR